MVTKKKIMMLLRLAMCGIFLTTNFLFVFSKPTPTPILTPVPMVAEKVDLENGENRLGSARSSHKFNTNTIICSKIQIQIQV